MKQEQHTRSLSIVWLHIEGASLPVHFRAQHARYCFIKDFGGSHPLRHVLGSKMKTTHYVSNERLT